MLLTWKKKNSASEKMLTIESAGAIGKSWILHQSTLWHEWDLWLNMSETETDRHPWRGALHVTTGQVRTSYWCAEAAQQISQYDQQAAFSLQEVIQLWPSKRGGRLPAKDRIDGWEKPHSGTKGACVTGGRCPRQIAALESECGKGPMGEKMFSSQQERGSFTQWRSEGKQEQCRAYLGRSSTSLT